MERKKLIIMVVSVIALLCVGIAAIAGGGLITPSVDLGDYVVITEGGYNGYGYFSATLDYEKLLEENEKHLTEKPLDAELFGNMTAKQAAEYIFERYEPYALAYENEGGYKNGDKVEFSWNINERGVGLLAQVFDAEIKHSGFEYKFKELKPVKEIDIFDHVAVDTWGISGEGCVSSWGKAIVEIEGKKDPLIIQLKIDTSKNGTLKNGDSIRMTMEDDYGTDFFVASSGVRFTRTEADVELNSFVYFSHENPTEILEHLGGQSIENSLVAVKDYVDVDREERTYTFVGAVYYYNNEGHAFKSGWNKNNQLVLIFRVDNGKVPGGWYTYLAPNNDVVIGYEATEDGEVVKATILDVEQPLDDNYYCYQKEWYSSFNKYPQPIVFEYDGVRYVGHQTIEDCIKAYEMNELKQNGRIYDNAIGDEVTKDFVGKGLE